MLTTEVKNQVLHALYDKIEKNRTGILNKNKIDIDNYRGKDLSMLDRLKVDDVKVDGMLQSIQEAIAIEDPEGRLLYRHIHDNGLEISNKTVAFGTVLIIYESRPDVTIEAAIAAFKSGNKILLKGGKEAIETNIFLHTLWEEALRDARVDVGYVKLLRLSREETQSFISNPPEPVDLIIPRGGERLIEFVKKNSSVPVIVSGRGNNFLYVDESADMDMSRNVILNGKSRISVCNALDKVIVHEKRRSDLDGLFQFLKKNGVQVIRDSTFGERSDIDTDQQEEVMRQEFLDYRMVFSLASSMEKAIADINEFSGGHSASIMTEDNDRAEFFISHIDSAAVYHNASTRFTDGGQFGMAGEMAISTQKLHFRGPISISQLVTNKWVIRGNGQIR